MIYEAFLDSEEDEEPKPPKKKPINPEKHKRLFFFDLDDEYRIHKACKAAVKFMETYGKGQESYMVDLKHYEQNIIPDEEDIKKVGRPKKPKSTKGEKSHD